MTDLKTEFTICLLILLKKELEKEIPLMLLIKVEKKTRVFMFQLTIH